MNSDGSSHTQVTQGDHSNLNPVLSSVGKIAFESTRDGNFEIYVVNADGTGLARITNNDVEDFTAAWSPDGKKIAFSRSLERQSSDIFVMDADGGNQTRLTESSTFNVSPAWSPDGDKIAYFEAGPTGREIYVINADGTGRTRLTDNDSEDGWPEWSPDGKKSPSALIVTAIGKST